MKKALILIACLLSIMAIFAACNAADGRVNNNNSVYTTPSTQNNTNTDNTVIDRTNSRVTSSRNNVVVNDHEYDSNYRDNNDGLINDVGSMIGEGLDDVGDGIENIGSTLQSDVNDLTDGREHTDNVTY